MNVTAWRDLAENVAGSAQRGIRMIMTGRIRQRTYDGREGGKVTVYELEATDAGISLQRATAKPVKAERVTGGNGGGAGQVCTRCGERHERYGPDGRPCYLAPVKDEPPF